MDSAMELTFTLRTPVPSALAGELSARIFFLSEEITGFRLLHEADQVVSVELATSTVRPAEDLDRRLHEMIASDVLTQRLPDPHCVWQSATGDSSCQDVFGEMRARRMAVPSGDGQMVLGSPALELIGALDSAIRNIAVRGLGASERRYPTLLPAHVLKRCGYFSSFPQFVLFTARLRTDSDNYRQFAAETEAQRSLGPGLFARCADVESCLPPTMCFHVFHELTERTVPTTGVVITTAGKSFRHESRYHRSLERLWDFTIRETVFLGTREYVLAKREQFMRTMLNLIEQWDLPGYCEVGNDPFFLSPATGERVWSQRLLRLKYELRLAIAPSRTIAVGSFNFHEKFFSEAFCIRLPGGSQPFTACVGFGLERLAYAFLCRHGLDPAAWPDLETSESLERI